MQTIINFYWDFGDDEEDVLLLDTPIDFADKEIDLFIVPDVSTDPVVHLSRGDGIEVISNTELKITCKRDKVKGSTWQTASWDLKITTAENWRDTLFGGKVHRGGYYAQKRIEGIYGKYE
ncbi:TPA: hypothetical protein ACX3BB_001232 [Pasteurella multocida]